MGFLDALDKVEKGAEDEIIKIAAESISTETEREYCVWVKPSEAGWAQLKTISGAIVVDMLLPTQKGRRRVRIRDGEANLTLKRFTEDGTKEEHSTLGMRTALSMYDMSPNIHVFKRCSLPATDEIIELSGGKAEWDIDMFVTSLGDLTERFQRLTSFNELLEEVETSSLYGMWVKVELEVEKFSFTSVVEYIPFEIDEWMPSRSKDAGTQAEISHYWDVLTNHAN